MIQEFQIRVLPEQAANEQSLKQFIGHDKGLDIRTIHALRILKRSIDARQRTIYVNLKVRLYINEMPQDEEFTRTIYNKVEGKPQVIVVGAGPGGGEMPMRGVCCRPCAKRCRAGVGPDRQTALRKGIRPRYGAPQMKPGPPQNEAVQTRGGNDHAKYDKRKRPDSAHIGSGRLVHGRFAR